MATLNTNNSSDNTLEYKLISSGVLCALLASWIFDISIWKIATLFLFAICIIVMNRLKKIENSRQYRLTRIYNINGEEVQNRWVNEVEDGYWVTVVTDVKNFDISYVEHTRTDENINKNGRENCVKKEHSYNFNNVWGDKYKGGKFGEKIIVVKE